ncbi:MAG: HDOD domain-containing protein [Pseudomonadales bacterium]
MTAAELALSANKLASFPDIVFRVNDAVADGSSNAKDIGSIIALDPSLTASLLRVANSALYKRANSVDSIESAVAMVGVTEIRNLVFAVSAGNTFQAIPNDIISMESFWKHSLYCAAAAQHLGNLLPNSNAQSLFTVGLLHDLGHLLMFNQCPELSKQSIEHSLNENDGLTPYVSEREIFGFDHMTVGAELAKHWNFPQPLQEGILNHHLPFDAERISDNSVIIHVANSVAVLAELESDNLAEAASIDPRALRHLKLEPEALYDAIQATHEAVPELLSLFSL